MGDKINKDFENFQKDLEIRKKKLKLLVEFEPNKNLNDVLKELSDKKISCICEQKLPIFYKGKMLSKKFRLDMLVENDIIVELKSVAHLGAEHRHQLCNYLRLTQKPVGLLINFGGNTLIGERWIFDKETNDCFIVDKNMTPIE